MSNVICREGKIIFPSEFLTDSPGTKDRLTGENKQKFTNTYILLIMHEKHGRNE